MRIIHAGGFPDDERRQNRAVIYSNMVVAFKILLEIMETENIEYQYEKTKVRTWKRYYFIASSLA
jgi:guanine nucleotide-binding protein subunit alpha